MFEPASGLAEKWCAEAVAATPKVKNKANNVFFMGLFLFKFFNTFCSNYGLIKIPSLNEPMFQGY